MKIQHVNMSQTPTSLNFTYFLLYKNMALPAASKGVQWKWSCNVWLTVGLWWNCTQKSRMWSLAGS